MGRLAIGSLIRSFGGLCRSASLWSVGRLASQAFGGLVGWLVVSLWVGWFWVGCFVEWLFGMLVGWSGSQCIGWFMACLVCRLVNEFCV